MTEIIARDPDYIRRLQQHPGITIFSRIENVRPFSAVLSEAPARENFIATRPHYIAAIMHRTVEEFAHFQKYEKPVISDLSGDRKLYVHSAAGPYEIAMLKTYLYVQHALETYYPKIQVRV
jgi:hypothetical protein